MAVNDDGRVIGAVSGGCVEGAVVVVAEGVIAGDDPQLLDFGIADEEAWDVGLPCGGEIWVWVERYATDGPQERFATLARDGGRGALVTALDGPAAGAKLLVAEDGSASGTLGDARSTGRPPRSAARRSGRSSPAATSTRALRCSWTSWRRRRGC